MVFSVKHCSNLKSDANVIFDVVVLLDGFGEGFFFGGSSLTAGKNDPVNDPHWLKSVDIDVVRARSCCS